MNILLKIVLLFGVASLQAMNPTVFTEYESLLIDSPNALVLQNGIIKPGLAQSIEWTDAPLAQKQLTEIQKIFAEKTNKYPIFLLNECTESKCPLNRSDKPAVRNAFENFVSQKLSSLLSTKKTISYVEFAAGELFGRTRIITKALNKQPEGNLALHLIDLEYQLFLNYHGGSLLIPYPVQLNFLLSGKETSKNVETIVTTAFRFDQLKNFLKHTAPKATITLVAHATVNDYISYVKKKSSPPADIIVASDMDDIPSVVKKSTFHYDELVARTLEKNPSLENYWLIKTQPSVINSGAGINSYSLNNKEKSSKNTVDIDGKKIDIFYTLQEIKN